jgi:hypothetical protein
MNSLFVISILSWVGMWFASHLGHPIGYVIPLIGLAATVAIALEARSPQAETEAIEPTARYGRQRRGASPEQQKDAVVSAYSTEIRNAA